MKRIVIEVPDEISAEDLDKLGHDWFILDFETQDHINIRTGSFNTAEEAIRGYQDFVNEHAVQEHQQIDN